jgi:hypothetical protein
MKFEELVVNGCSYMEAYSAGSGHQDLAERLGIPTASSLAIGGSANGRILRTTMKHSFATTRPTFYVLGMTFLSRDELPILHTTNQFEGAWTNPQNQAHESLWVHPWSIRDTEQYVELKLKWEWTTAIDRYEDLQYRILAVIDSLSRRGHGVLVYNQADEMFLAAHEDSRLRFFRGHYHIVGDYHWMAISWQHEQGVPAMDYAIGSTSVRDAIKHRKSGRHDRLNAFLADHIQSHGLLA